MTNLAATVRSVRYMHSVRCVTKKVFGWNFQKWQKSRAFIRVRFYYSFRYGKWVIYRLSVSSSVRFVIPIHLRSGDPIYAVGVDPHHFQPARLVVLATVPQRACRIRRVISMIYHLPLVVISYLYKPLCAWPKLTLVRILENHKFAPHTFPHVPITKSPIYIHPPYICHIIDRNWIGIPRLDPRRLAEVFKKGPFCPHLDPSFPPHSTPNDLIRH